MKTFRSLRQASFSVPMIPVIVIGLTIGTVFLSLVSYGPLGYDMLRRYCLGHPVALASVELFAIAIVALAVKWSFAVQQTRRASKASSLLRRIVADGQSVSPSARTSWLEASWASQPSTVRDSWFGSRLRHVLERQASRGRRHQMESDLKSIAESDADRQHESYSLLRIINWAMPMLGFLGTVLGISQTLGTMDMQLLATEQQTAMNQLTAGLYVAFDTTAIALILTVIAMFLQFAVSKIEMNLLTLIDEETNESLIAFLTVDPFDTQETLLEPVRQMATELLTSVRSLVEEQSAIWARSITESQQQWMEWTERAASTVDAKIGENLSESLRRHASTFERLQDEGTRQIDMRLQQWQTTLSDQARLVQGQQKEVIRQTEAIQAQTDTIQRLLESTTEIHRLEHTIHESVSRLENVGKIEQASLCVGEAVAVLATSLERAGLLRGGPVRPRTTVAPTQPQPAVDVKSAIDNSTQRKAA